MVFANKLFANIAGKSEQEKTDLVIIDTGESDIDSFRNSSVFEKSQKVYPK